MPEQNISKSRGLRLIIDMASDIVSRAAAEETDVKCIATGADLFLGAAATIALTTMDDPADDAEFDEVVAMMRTTIENVRRSVLKAHQETEAATNARG
ncbi:hypothetical protein [uncultured Maritimibacter sp.]|uniref:hypothetical protein n=1 Tax=uncultured Maritimibacter sp. TaxID=991866 RepID=UPI00259AE2DC|nr:hypothetical protein [uncultured Maritimibacter sp.]